MKIKIIDVETTAVLAELEIFGGNVNEDINAWTSEDPKWLPISTSLVLDIAGEKYFVHEKTYFYDERIFYVKVSKATPEQLAAPSSFQLIEDDEMLEIVKEFKDEKP